MRVATGTYGENQDEADVRRTTGVHSSADQRGPLMKTRSNIFSTHSFLSSPTSIGKTQRYDPRASASFAFGWNAECRDFALTCSMRTSSIQTSLDNPRQLGTTPWTRQRQLYNKDRPELHDFLVELRSLLDEYPETMAVGETFDAQPEMAASYCKQLHMAFDFDFLQQPWKPRSFQRTIEKWDRLLASQDSWPCYVLSNHDNPRHAGRYGQGVSASEADARAKIAAALLLTLRGTPFIYSGEEIGLRDVPIPSHEEWDVAFKGGSRDPSRTPMQWNSTIHAGFSSGHPWLRVAPDYRTRNVAIQDGDPRSILNFYRRLVTLSNETPALLFGDWRPLQDTSRCTLVYLREYQGAYALVALNFSHSRQRVTLDTRLPVRYWNARLSTRRPDVGWAVRLDQTLELGPYEATVFTSGDMVSQG